MPKAMQSPKVIRNACGFFDRIYPPSNIRERFSISPDKNML